MMSDADCTPGREPRSIVASFYILSYFYFVNILFLRRSQSSMRIFIIIYTFRRQAFSKQWQSDDIIFICDAINLVLLISYSNNAKDNCRIMLRSLNYFGTLNRGYMCNLLHAINCME